MYRQALLMSRLRVTVCTNEHANPEDFPPSGFTIKTVEGRKEPPKKLVSRKAALMVRSWRNRHYGGYRGAPSEALWWAEQIRQDRPSIVLAQFGTFATHVLPLFEPFSIPLVAHFHGMDLSGKLQQAGYRRRLISACKRLTAFVVVAEYMRDWLVEHGAPVDRVFKIPCGAPFDQLQPSDAVGAEPCRFLAVGRLVGKKRPDLTIQAFAMVAQQAPGTTLVVVGGGPMEGECRQLASELGVADRVEFLGNQPPERVVAELARASVFVQHSVTAANGDKEGWPVAIAEAIASGLPIVSTLHASIPEQVSHGQTGLLCEEGDWQKMGEHMTRLALNPAERRAMGAAGREKISAFETKNQVTQLEDVLLKFAK